MSGYSVECKPQLPAGRSECRKINSHITKKVADKLEEIFKKDRKSFEEKWESLGLFVKYGMMTDDKFLEKANKFNMYEDAGRRKILYAGRVRLATETLQKNKDGKLVILYTTDPVQQDIIYKLQSKKIIWW